MFHLEERRAALSRELEGRFSLSRHGERRYDRDLVNQVIVRAGEQSYDVFVGSRLLEQTGLLVSGKFKGPACAIVSDDNVAALFAESVSRSLTDAGFRPTLITVRPGESSKAISEAEAICDRMIEAGLDRSSFVVALGGGMIGDLAGFVAAIYHRGIPCVQVPTTLLAQVDSSIGGKTGVNTAAGKNLIGAWHQPALVISDVETLTTLPPREWRQGFAEIVKHAVIRDAEMFEALQRFDRREMAALIRRNVEIKAAIVAADERETTGERALLNFGHTIGHAIERAGDFLDFLHGEAISLGIVAACEISTRKASLSETERERIIQTLQSFELPTRLPADFPKEKILEAIRFDKKFERGEIRFVVVPAIGSARVATDVTMEDIEAAVENL
jgi:3-dehydroquinate synthase